MIGRIFDSLSHLVVQSGFGHFGLILSCSAVSWFIFVSFFLFVHSSIFFIIWSFFAYFVSFTLPGLQGKLQVLAPPCDLHFWRLLLDVPCRTSPPSLIRLHMMSCRAGNSKSISKMSARQMDPAAHLKCLLKSTTPALSHAQSCSCDLSLINKISR